MLFDRPSSMLNYLLLWSWFFPLLSFLLIWFLLPPPDSQVIKTAWLWSTITITSEQVPVTVQPHLWRSKGIAGETWLWVNSLLIIVRRDWKTDCSFGISDTNHYTNTNRNLLWSWFRWNCLGKYLQNVINNIFLGVSSLLLMHFCGSSHNVTTNKQTYWGISYREKASFYYLGTGREQLPTLMSLLPLWERTMALISPPAACSKSSGKTSIIWTLSTASAIRLQMHS